MSFKNRLVKAIMNKGTYRIGSRLASLTKHLMKKKAASRLVSLVEKAANEPKEESEEDGKKKKPTLLSKILPVIESVVEHRSV